MFENFIFSLNAVLPIFTVALTGYLLKNKGFLTDGFVTAADKLVFKLLLPCMLFTKVAYIDAKSVTGKDFQLSTAKLDGGKTGYLESSFLVCHASAKRGGGKYIAVLGDASGSSVKTSCGLTMKDLKLLLDTYVK